MTHAGSEHVLSGGGRESTAALSLALAALIACSGCSGAARRPTVRVRLAGAQIPVELVASWLAESRETRFRVEQVPPVFLSGNGFEHLRASACDIACTDRTIVARERDEFAGEPLEAYRVAFYGYAFYVHPDNPLDSVFAGHLDMLFQKRITDWSQLFTSPEGALEGPIRLIGPEKETRGGEMLTRRARIWFDKATWETRPSDAAIIRAVAQDPLALGFACIGLDQGVRYLGLRMGRRDKPAFPSLEEIESERYGLAKVIYIYYRGPADPAVAAVRDFLFSESGRSAIEETDVWPIAFERARVDH